MLRPDGTEREVEARADFLVRDGRRVAMVSAIRDVTERKRLERAQQDFLAMASHDLAAPVTVLRARAQLLQRLRAYDEASVSAILEQADRMDRLIGDLRDVVRVEGGGLAVRRDPVDLVALAREAVGRARTLAAGHAVGLKAPETPVVVAGDRDRIGQVLDNLLGNAVKYSPPGGEVLVRVEPAEREVLLHVADRGPGIPADVLPHLFERFYRGHRAAGDSGLGLGLYIARALVEAHGGRLWAASEPGTGSTFSVALPVGPRAQPRRGRFPYRRSPLKIPWLALASSEWGTRRLHPPAPHKASFLRRPSLTPAAHTMPNRSSWTTSASGFRARGGWERAPSAPTSSEPKARERPPRRKAVRAASGTAS